MKNIGLLLFFLPTGLWAKQLLDWDDCFNTVCFWMAKARNEEYSKIILKFSSQNDCSNLIEPVQEDVVKLRYHHAFSFNANALYTRVPSMDIHSFQVKIDNDEHCLPIHCHPSEESCHLEHPSITTIII